MKKENRKYFTAAILMLIAFVLWTVAVCVVDVQAIGPQETRVGFATMNRFVHNLTGVYMDLYTITDWLGLVPVVFVLGFGFLGLIQWIKRKSITKVDFDILLLGGFYIIVIGAYLFFEMFPVNFRPVLIEGYLEASYPSSTTLLVLCVMPTAMIQFSFRIKNPIVKYGVQGSIGVFTIFMVLGRLISGVHWFSDILGGIFLSTGLVLMYYAFIETKPTCDFTGRFFLYSLSSFCLRNSFRNSFKSAAASSMDTSKVSVTALRIS